LNSILNKAQTEAVMRHFHPELHPEQEPQAG
jgi:hypothetical protein